MTPVSESLQSMNAALGSHLVLQQAVHHAMTRRLHLRLEGFGGDEDAVEQWFGQSVSQSC